MAKSKKTRKPEKPLKVTPSLGRDFVTLGEITHGSGAGAHKLKNQKRQKSNSTQTWLDQEPHHDKET